MDQPTLLAVRQLFLGLLQVAAYGLLFVWSYRIVAALPLKNYFRKLRFYHTLIPSLALAGAAFLPVKLVLDLLFSFPVDFSPVPIPALLSFFEGVALLLLVVFHFSGEKREVQLVAWGKKLWESLKVGYRWAYLVGGLLVLVGAYGFSVFQGYLDGPTLLKPRYLECASDSLPFSFSYSSKFKLDEDEARQFGESYLVGFKLPSDSRIGCEVRGVQGNLVLGEDLPAVAGKLADVLSAGTEGFTVLDSAFVNVGGGRGIKLAVSFRGPGGETLRSDQVFTSREDRVYTWTCGAPEGAYQSYADDFAYFFKNFSWK